MEETRRINRVPMESRKPKNSRGLAVSKVDWVALVPFASCLAEVRGAAFNTIETVHALCRLCGISQRVSAMPGKSRHKRKGSKPVLGIDKNEIPSEEGDANCGPSLERDSETGKQGNGEAGNAEQLAPGLKVRFPAPAELVS